MGKQGPCCHCGVTSTPLWRNGPPEKPVLCNACGSRWRTKGSLANYTPLHARLDPDEYEDHRTRVKTISLKRREEKLNKRKHSDIATDGDYAPDYSLGFPKILDEDTSNRSSSGSAVSNSESCAQFGSGDASDLTGPAQSIVWDGLVPSKKRTCVTRPKQSSVEKLTKDLHTILHEQASQFSSITEEDLLFESEAPMGSVEFGHGSVLIRHPRSLAKEEESEASSLSVDNKLHRVDEGYYATPASMVSVNASKSLYNPCSQAEKVKKINGQMVKLEHAKRDKSGHEKSQILLNHESPLHQIDLSEIANSDVFWGRLTVDEQQALLKYLPSVDTSALSDGLKSMFDSPYFMESLSSFQKLLAEGVLDSSVPGVKTEDSKAVKGLALSNLTMSKWVERYNMMKDKKGKKSTGECISISGSKSSSSGYAGTAKKFQDSQNHVFPEAKPTPKISKRVTVKGVHKGKETTQNESSCFTPTSRNIFALQADGNSLMLDSLQFEDESSDQDLLLDIPSNSSFPEAELLHPACSFAS